MTLIQLVLGLGVGVPSAQCPVPSVPGSARPSPTPAPCHLGPSGPGPWALGPGHSHDLHISHTRLVLEGTTLALRVRLFHDDLTDALRRFSGRPDLEITPDNRADSVFARYFARAVRLEGNDRRLTLAVTASAMERDDAAQDVVWYVMEGSVSRMPDRLLVLNGLLFEVYDDQQNIVQVLRLPGDMRRTIYFTARDPKAQVLDFR